MPKACPYISGRIIFGKLHKYFVSLQKLPTRHCREPRGLCPSGLFIFHDIVEHMFLHGHVQTGLKDIAVLVDYHAEGYS